MKRYKTPFDAMRPALEVSRMLIEAQQVIALRLAGMAGFWPMGQAETSRMVEEKLEAMGESAQAALRAGLTGKSPGAIVLAAVKPVRRRTKANAARLVRKAVPGAK